MSRAKIVAGRTVILIEAQDMIDKTLGKVRTKLHKLSNGLNNVGQNLTRTGFFGAVGSGLMLANFVKFEDQMLELRVKMGLLGETTKQQEEQFRSLSKLIRELGKSTTFTSQQVAAAATELAKAGFNEAEGEISNTVAAVLDLARAQKIDGATATTFLSNAMRAFGISTKDAGLIASQLSRATRSGTLDIEDLGQALKFASATSNELGESLPLVLAAMAQISNKGLRGSIAGTSFNAALVNLAKKAPQIADQLGVAVATQPNGQLDLLSTLLRLNEATKQMSRMKRVEIFGNLFNLRGMRSFLPTSKDAVGLMELTNFIAAAGNEADLAARTMDSGLGGAIRLTVAAFDDLTLTIGDASKKAIVPLLIGIRELVNSLNALAAVNPVLSSLVVLSPALLLSAGLGFIALAKGARLAAFAVGGLINVFRPLSKFLVGGIGQQLAALSFANKNLVSGIQGAGSKIAGGASGLAARVSSMRTGATTKVATPEIKARYQAAMAAQREAKATLQISKAQTDLARASAKLASNQEKIRRNAHGITAALDQNTRSIALNASNLKTNANNLRLYDAYQTSIDRLRKEAYDLQVKADKTKNVRSPSGGLRSVSALPEGELAALIREREMREHQVFRLQKEQTKLGLRPQEQLQRRQNLLIKERQTLLMKNLKLQEATKATTKVKAAIEAKFTKELTKGQDVLLSANKARQAAQIKAVTTSPASRRSLSSFLGRGLQATKGGILKGATASARGLMKVGTGLRRVFGFLSSGGLFTILEILILFGDKIPVVSGILGRFGKAFSGAFGEVVKIGNLMSGPFALFKAGFKLLSNGQGAAGLEAIKQGFLALVSIIQDQLVAAWNRFKEALGPVYDTLRAIITSVLVAVDAVVNGIGQILGNKGKLIGAIGEATGISDMFGSGGGIAAAAKGIGQTIAMLIPTLTNWLVRLQNVFDYSGKVFAAGISNAVRSILPSWMLTKDESYISPNEVNKLSTEQQKRLEQQLKNTKETKAGRIATEDKNYEGAFRYGLRKGIIDKEFSYLADKYVSSAMAQEQMAGIEKSFADKAADAAYEKQRQAILTAFNKSAAVEGKVRADAANASAEATNKEALSLADQFNAWFDEVIKKLTDNDRRPRTMQPQDARTQMQMEMQARAAQLAAARMPVSALVGSASQTRGNLLRSVSKIEKQQLNVLEDIRDDQRLLLENRGDILRVK